MRNFKAGTRGTHAKDMYGMQMRPMSLTLLDEAAIVNMAVFINGLK